MGPYDRSNRPINFKCLLNDRGSEVRQLIVEPITLKKTNLNLRALDYIELQASMSIQKKNISRLIYTFSRSSPNLISWILLSSVKKQAYWIGFQIIVSDLLHSVNEKSC